MILNTITDTKTNAIKDQENRKKRWLDTGLEEGHLITACVTQEAYPEMGISQQFETWQQKAEGWSLTWGLLNTPPRTAPQLRDAGQPGSSGKKEPSWPWFFVRDMKQDKIPVWRKRTGQKVPSVIRCYLQLIVSKRRKISFLQWSVPVYFCCTLW